MADLPKDRIPAEGGYLISLVNRRMERINADAKLLAQVKSQSEPAKES